MTNDAVKHAAITHANEVMVGNHLPKGSIYSAVETAFIAGADWQRDQFMKDARDASVRLVPRLGPGVVVGVDYSSGPDHTSRHVVMSKEAWDTVQADLRTRSDAVDNWRQQVGKLESRVATISGDNRKLEEDRDDWHHAYDKLVSDIVHGRSFTAETDASGTVIGLARPPVTEFTWGVGRTVNIEEGNADYVSIKPDDAPVMHFRKPELTADEASAFAATVEKEYATGGFTAQGETERRQPSVLERLLRIEEVLFSE